MKPNDFSDIKGLIIEDVTFISGLIRRMLRTLQISDVWEAADGSEALQMLAGPFHPHLIICDVRMEPMDGLTFLGRLRASSDAERAGLPVIMLTSVTEEGTVRDTKGLGVSGYLLKPVSPKQLSDRVKAIFGL